MENTNLDGYGGGVLPPTPEDYRKMWEEQSKQLKEVEYQKRAEANRRKAIKQVLQDNVKKAVQVRNPDWEKNFYDNIDIRDD